MNDAPEHRSLDELLEVYRQYIHSKVSKVRILGEAEERELKDVFVELSVVEDRDRPRQAEFLGMMDAVMRRRFDFSGDPQVEGDTGENEREKEANQRVRPNDLLRWGTKAIISGAPGCGKTTLLKYLALRAQKEKRFVVWIELKAIDKNHFTESSKRAARKGILILQELWLGNIGTQLSLSDPETELLGFYWQKRLLNNEIIILLDGFDEIQDEAVERSLDRGVHEFASAFHYCALLISTRPYALARIGKELLRELEIEPLNRQQVEAFLSCYYPDDPAIKSLLEKLKKRSSLSELFNAPLLLGVIMRLQKKNDLVDDRLVLYDKIINDLVRKLDKSKSVNRRFRIDDERLRLDFIKFLAFERLLRDQLTGEEREVNRLVFDYDLLKEKASAFLKHEHLSHNPRILADDALATPLLREIGTDTYAFTHLILHEYLAAATLAKLNESDAADGSMIFSRAYFNPMIVEMEVLPMTLGLIKNADRIYAEIERWPESLNFTSVRLRAKGLGYAAKIEHDRLSNLIVRMHDFVFKKNPTETPYRWRVIESFRNISRSNTGFFETGIGHLISTLYDENMKRREEACWALGILAPEKAIDPVISMLKDKNPVARGHAASALGEIGSEKAVDPLILMLKDKNITARRSAIYALGKIGSDNAVDPLVSIMTHGQSTIYEVTESLERIGSEKAAYSLVPILKRKDHKSYYYAGKTIVKIGSEGTVDRLASLLEDKDDDVRRRVAELLGKIGLENAVGPLVSLLAKEQDYSTLETVVDALAKIGSDNAVDPLIEIVYGKYTHATRYAISALKKMGSERAVDRFISDIDHKDFNVQYGAVLAAGEMRSERAVDPLISALNEKRCSSEIKALGKIGSEKAVGPILAVISYQDEFDLSGMAEALGRIGSKKAVDCLISLLSNRDEWVRWKAAEALGRIASNKAVDPLISALADKDENVRCHAAEALGRIGSEKAVDPLITALSDRNKYVRFSAVEALGSIGSGRAIDPLITIFNKRSMKWRMIEALGRIGSRKVLTPLTVALRDNNPSIRHRAADALVQTGLESAIDVLALVINDKDEIVRQRVIEAVAKTRSKKFLDLFSFVLQNDESWGVCSRAADALVQIRTEEAVDVMISGLNCRHENVRANLAIKLGSMGSAKAVDALKTNLQDKDWYAGLMAAEALAQIGSDKAIDYLLSAIGDRNATVRANAADALARTRPVKLIAGLTRAIDRTGKTSRARSIEVIGYYSDDEKLLEQLNHIAKSDKDKEIREAAKEAAEKFARKMDLLGRPRYQGTVASLGDNKSREQVLIGEVYRIVGEAGHLFRQHTEHDNGIDGEIEFKNDRGEASGKRIYLQLKSGDSYLRKRKKDGKEIFSIKPRHAEYWQVQAYPVILVIRNSDGRIRWMNVTRYLRWHGQVVTQIEFEGGAFTAEAVRQMREKSF